MTASEEAEKKRREKIAKDGDLALKLISDYPLYASTSGILYEEAIGIAKVLYGKDWKKEAEEVDG